MLYVLNAGCAGQQKKEAVSRTIDSTAQTATTKKDVSMENSPYIDNQEAPLPMEAIGKYDERVKLQRYSNLPVTHPDAYQLRRQQAVYPGDTKQITLDIINMDGPTAEPGYHWMEHWEKGKWVTFPFRSNIAFSGPGRVLAKGDIVPEHIKMSEFEDPLKPNRYKVHFYVLASIHTDCILTDSGVQSVKGSEVNEAFTLRVLDSKNDSISILLENHTNLPVQPLFLPSIGPDKRRNTHPLARSGWREEANWMKEHVLLKSGEGILFKFPTSWNINELVHPNNKGKYKPGKLTSGTYQIGLLLEVYMTTEFEVE